MDNPLWEFSLKVYALDQVAPCCLELQDKFGLDVNLLLYAAWLAESDRLLTDSHLAALDAEVAEWRNMVITPLRALRLQLRNYLPEESVASELNVVDELKALEVRAERQQQNRMYAYSCNTPALPKADYPLLGNLTAVAQFASPADAGWAPSINYLNTLLPRG
jgi:uncharacterized protein (TIGR02444 family)